MSEWINVRLGDLGNFSTSSVDKKLVEGEKVVNLINYMDVYKSNTINSSIDFMQVTASTVEAARSQVLIGDILFTPSSETPDDIGHSAVVAENLRNTLHSYHTVRLRPHDENTLDIRFSAWFCNASEVRKEFEQKCAGSTRYTLSIPAFRSIEIKIPKSKKIQNKIAEYLDTLDKAIEKTEALIEKYQQIKAGLMHDLFTRGIGADGKLRPPREQAPELYQQTQIGWIPKEWQIKPCSDLCFRICVGIVIQPTKYYVGDGIPALRSANVREDGIDPNNFVYISAASNQQLAKSQLKTGDIVSVRTGYPGTSAVVSQEFHGANCIDILISTPNKKVNSEYLCDWINSSFGKGQVLRQQGGMAQQHFNVGEMRELLVALPVSEEQLKIRSRISVIAEKIKVEKALLDKRQKQKFGLMHDLLTGKVQVNVDQSEAAHV